MGTHQRGASAPPAGGLTAGVMPPVRLTACPPYRLTAYRRMSVLTRRRTLHHREPHRFDSRSVTLASPVIPGRQRPSPRSPTRASTAPDPSAELSATPPTRPPRV